MRNEEPPSAAQISTALAKLRPSRARIASLHLALPADVAPGPSVRERGPAWVWRGASAPADGAGGASLLVSLAWRDGDAYLDLEGPPSSWVKPLRSGAFTITFGSDVLLDLPLLLLDDAAAPLWQEAVEDADAGILAPGRQWREFDVTATPVGWAVTASR